MTSVMTATPSKLTYVKFTDISVCSSTKMVKTILKCVFHLKLVYLSSMHVNSLCNDFHDSSITYQHCRIIHFMNDFMTLLLYYETHLIKMSRMSANYIVGKTAKYDQKLLLAHFQISLKAFLVSHI